MRKNLYTERKGIVEIVLANYNIDKTALTKMFKTERVLVLVLLTDVSRKTKIWFQTCVVKVELYCVMEVFL